jgi:hypothetical protein
LLQKVTLWKARKHRAGFFITAILLKAMNAGKGDALRQEQGLFCILFVAAWTKRMASGGTRPAGSVFALKKRRAIKEFQFSTKKQTSHVSKMRFVNNLKPLQKCRDLRLLSKLNIVSMIEDGEEPTS